MYNHPRHRIVNAAVAGLLLLAGAQGLEARDEQLPSELVGVDILPHIGTKVDLDLQFTAENGYQFPLRKYFGKGKPVILNFVYYRCPMLCNLVLNGQTAAFKELAWTAGKEFDVVTISIAPDEGYDLAKAKKQFYLESYGRDEAYGGWHFLSDYQGNVKRLADQVGFQYRWDPKGEQWAHTAAILVLTADGQVSQYLYGVRYKERDLRLALTEASQGKLGTLADKMLLFCFHYDPEAKGYVPFARNLMKAGGGLMVLVMGVVISVLFRRERKGALPTGVATVK